MSHPFYLLDYTVVIETANTMNDFKTLPIYCQLR